MGANQLFRAADIEIVIISGGEVVALAQQVGDLVLRFGYGRLGDGGAINVIEPEGAGDFLLHGGVGHEHEIILVLTGGGNSFALQGSDHFAGQGIHADGLAQRIFAAEEAVDHGLPDHANQG